MIFKTAQLLFKQRGVSGLTPNIEMSGVMYDIVDFRRSMCCCKRMGEVYVTKINVSKPWKQLAQPNGMMSNGRQIMSQHRRCVK
jgi:hypothetical protein